MEILRADLGTCADLRETVVVIDVLRSFSTAGYAFAAGGMSASAKGFGANYISSF